MVRLWNIRRPQGKECKTSAVTEQLGAAVSLQVQQLDVWFAAPHRERTSMKSACRFDAIKRSRRGGAAGMHRTIAELLILRPACPRHVCMVWCLFQARPPVSHEACCLKRGPDERRSGWEGGAGGLCIFHLSAPLRRSCWQTSNFLARRQSKRLGLGLLAPMNHRLIAFMCVAASLLGCSSERLSIQSGSIHVTEL